MTELVACLSTGKGTWAHVSRLINDQEWENIILITNDFGKEKFTSDKKFEMIVINSNETISKLVEQISAGLKDKIKGTEVAVNLISGSGKEHMAMLSALLKIGVGIRFIALTQEGIKEI